MPTPIALNIATFDVEDDTDDAVFVCEGQEYDIPDEAIDQLAVWDHDGTHTPNRAALKRIAREMGLSGLVVLKPKH